jgi:hypothetical protein
MNQHNEQTHHLVTKIEELGFFCGVSEQQKTKEDVAFFDVRLRENKKEEAIMI